MVLGHLGNGEGLRQHVSLHGESQGSITLLEPVFCMQNNTTRGLLDGAYILLLCWLIKLLLWQSFLLPGQSPIYTHVSETLQGLTTIRALNMEDRTMKKFDDYMDSHTAMYSLFLSGMFSYILLSDYILIVNITICIVFALTTSGKWLYNYANSMNSKSKGNIK